MQLDPDDIHARAEALVGQVIGGRYRLDAVLGIGAMGAVYRGYHTGLERSVAVKLLHKDLMGSEEMRARFAREASAVSKLDHPNCVRVTDFGNDEEYQFLVMELLEGTPLGHELQQPLPAERALGIIDEVLAGLEHAHGHGLVHRDIKPDNVFLARDGDKVRVKLLDFGIVKLQEGSGNKQLTQMGMIFGTPHFMSPEQATGGEIDARADLYAAGVVLYTMLAGRLPFDDDDPLKVLRQQIRDEPPALPDDVPDPVRGLVTKLLAKKPEQRHASAAETRKAVADVREALAPAPQPAPQPAPTSGMAATPGTLTVPAMPGAAPSPVPAGPPVMVPPRGGGPAWGPPSKTTKLAAGGVGALLLVVIIAVAAGGGDDEPAAPAPEAQAEAARSGLEALLGGSSEAGKAKTGEAGEDADGEDAQEDAPSNRSLEANYTGVDLLIAAKQYESARITLGPLLEAHPNDAGLHRRMGQVLVALAGADNRAAALQSYASAIRADAGQLDDETFMTELGELLDDAKLREPAVTLAIELLGTRMDDQLLEWLNVQGKPLPFESRHALITHLEGHDRGQEISRPLQRALDLWQASEAEDPCAAFGRALEDASAHPDSFLVGTLRGVTVPTGSAPKDDAEPAACPGAADQLEKARATHDRMFAGIDPVVPKAYRARPSKGTSSSGGRKRRR
ncbi:serine/threonine protein kinase [Paraliomyxa miuraensis]|uniref:serine/threonine protein kinase n=1 Tax=Paraliomyxa miuraensis TaxID=376150 RepID=UPI00224F9EFA|nr:serine/threonine-protein kinase [Paraliomyxa miuraensis]MCX4247977.1 serine/threonine protein kinase [Paraliomyxa miuraensis]